MIFCFVFINCDFCSKDNVLARTTPDVLLLKADFRSADTHLRSFGLRTSYSNAFTLRSEFSEAVSSRFLITILLAISCDPELGTAFCGCDIRFSGAERQLSGVAKVVSEFYSEINQMMFDQPSNRCRNGLISLTLTLLVSLMM